MRRSVAAVVALVLAGWLGAGGPAMADGDRLIMEAKVDGKVVGDGRMTIDPARPTTIEITVSNPSTSTQRVKTVRLSGSALALTFFAYDTTVAFDVPAGGNATRSFPLDLADLDRQATGLLPASVTLLGNDREVLAEVETTSDVRGSLWSVYGVFGIALIVLTALAWVSALVALARQRLPANRWRRALRFVPAGFGAGLSAVVTLSVLRLVPPAPTAEIPLILGAAAVTLALGYLTPYPGDEAEAAYGPERGEDDFDDYDTAYDTGTHDPDTYDTGSYDPDTYDTGTRAHNTAIHDTRAHDTATYDTGTYDTATHDTGAHNTGAHNTGPHDTGTYDTRARDTATHSTGAYETGTYLTEAYKTEAYKTDGGHDAGYEAGGQPRGREAVPLDPDATRADDLSRELLSRQDGTR